MQRDPRKPNYGGASEASAGGATLKGEDSLTCAKRELFEETGICSDALEEIGHFTSHNAIFFNFLCVTDCDKSSITLQEGETVAYKWISEKDFIAFVNSADMIPSQRTRYSDYLKKLGYIVK